MFDKIDEQKWPTKTKGLFIKGIIHFTDDNKGFEVLQEEFFFNHLEKNGEFLGQDDFDIRLDYELKNDVWDIKPKAGEVYGVLWNFNLQNSKYWTACGYEYDNDIETVSLEFSLFDEQAKERIFSDDMYQLEGAVNV